MSCTCLPISNVDIIELRQAASITTFLMVIGKLINVYIIIIYITTSSLYYMTVP